MMTAFAFVGYLWLLLWANDIAAMVAILGLLCYIEFHARGINSRIDAILKEAASDGAPERPAGQEPE